MLVPVSSQAYIFLYTVLGGLLVGFVYDLFRVSRKVIKTKNVVVYFEDIAFWLLVSLITFATLFISNAGEIRGYALIGIILGVIIYAFLLSQYVITFLMRTIAFIKRALKFIYRIISLPIKFLMKILYYPILYLRRSYRAVSKFFGRIFSWIKRRIRLNIKNIKTTLKKI